MNGIVMGLAMLISSTPPVAAPEARHALRVPAVFRVDVPESTSGLATARLYRESPGRPRPHGLRPSAQAAKRSRVDRIIAIVAGASIGWVVGGRIGYAVTPKRGPYDDTSGLKGVLIGAPIGGVAGALIGYRLTR